MRIVSISQTLGRSLAALIVLTSCLSLGAQATSPASRQAQLGFAKLPLNFEPNRGQAEANVQFIARSPAATVLLSGADAFLRTSNFKKDAHGLTQVAGAYTVRMHLEGASKNAVATASDAQSGTVSYMQGSDRSRWHTGLPTYGMVTLPTVYPGVDLRYYGRQGQLEYDFIVAPKADPSVVKLQFAGSTASLAKNGDLELPAGNSTLRFDKPVAYQMVGGKRVNVEAAFAMSANREVTFKLGAYDHNRELTIDPTLLYLGTLGTGAGNVDVSQITVDSTGALYLIGTTNDATFPVSTGAYQTMCGPANATAAGNNIVYCTGGYTSAFITKLSPDGTKLVYSTYLSGHAGGEQGSAIAVDSTGVAYLFGMTGSDDFPVTSDAFQKNCYAFYGAFGAVNPVKCDGNYNGGGTEYTIANHDAFFAKLNETGTALLYSSFLGGAQPVYPVSLTLDGSGNIYLYGQTSDLNANDRKGNLGYTGITASGFQTISTATGTGDQSTNTYSINTAPFLSKFTNDGHTLLFGTFFDDNVYGVGMYPTSMVVGSNGIAYIAGYSAASNQNDTPGAVKTACTQVDPNSQSTTCTTYDGFLAAINTTKSGTASLAWATRIGGTDPTQGSNTPITEILGLTVDSSSNIYATGYADDHSFPVGGGGFQATCPNYDATQSTYDYCDSAFVIKVNPSGTKILAGTFLDGPSFRSAGSVGYNVRLDSKGKIYVYGRSDDGGGNFPQVNPLQAYKGGNQLFISTFSADLSKLIFSTRFGNPSYVDHSVAPAGGMVLDSNDNIYFAGTTNDTMFAGTTGTYNTAAASGQGDHAFFGKLSKVAQPDTTTLTLTPATVGQGGTITYKAVVVGTAQSTPVPTGTVTFSYTSAAKVTTVAGTATLDGTGTATFTDTAPAVGTYTVTASYGADNVYDNSVSAAITLTVNNGNTTNTALTVAPAAARIGATVTLTAAVTGTGGTPTGTVTFLDGTTVLGTVTLSGGSATLTKTNFSTASHSVTARYSGDGSFAASTSAAQTVVVSLNTVTVALFASPAVSPVGGTVTLTATFAGATSTMAPTGKITFYNGTVAIGTVAVANNAASVMTAALPTGTSSITAMYSGDTLYSSITSSSQTVVVRASAATNTTLSSSSASVTVGSSITFKATISSSITTGAPSGMVTFMDGSTVLGMGTVAGGVATYSTSSLAVGAHSITAAYEGDGLFMASTSTAFSQIVVVASIALSTPTTSITVLRDHSVTAVISATPSGNYTGTLNFTCGPLPTYASCAFAPAALTFSGTSAVQTTTLTFNTKSTMSARLEHQGFGSKATGVLAASLFLPVGLLGLVFRRRKTGLRTLSLLTLLLAVSLGAVGLSGCAGSSTPTTSVGTYTVPVTATVNGTTTTLNLDITVK